MKARYLCTLLLILISGISAWGQNNTLSIPNVTVNKGKSIDLPIQLDNTADIIAVQFTLAVPEGLSLNTSEATLSERCSSHSLKMEQITDGQYMTMIYSATNQPIVGRTGQILSIPLTAATTLEEGTELALQLSQVVIADAQGNNLVTSYNAGHITIAKSADLQVSQVEASVKAIQPSEQLKVSWMVENIGGEALRSGWNEQISLVATDGTSKLIGTTYYDGSFAAGGAVSRNATLTLPAQLGIDGLCTVRVKLNPNSDAGEPTWLLANNTASSEATLSVKKILQLTPQSIQTEESSGQQLRFMLMRSGNTSKEESFALTATNDSRIEWPKSVTLKTSQASAYFYAQVTPNGRLDDNGLIVIDVAGTDYETVHSQVQIEDDTYPSLQLIPSATEVTEGESLEFTVTSERAVTEDLVLTLTCDHTARFTLPAEVKISKGQSKVSFTAVSKDDQVPDVDAMVTFSVAAARHNPASTVITLHDDDVPSLKLALTPTAVSEAAGPLSVTAILSRTDNIDKQVTVKFTDDSNGQIYYGRESVEMAPGVKEVSVNLGPIDNNKVDGERSISISAAVFIASCSCNAQSGTSGGVVSAPLTIYDNDGPTLTLTSSSSVVNEGGDLTVTIQRNTSTESALVVSLSSDHDRALDYPATITIPAGADRTTCTIRIKQNDVTGDGYTAILTAAASGFSTGNIWFTISDQTLPDAQISEIKASETEVEIGSKVRIDFTVSNTGAYSLAESTPIAIYTQRNDTAAAMVYLRNALAPGEQVSMAQEISLPNRIGSYSIFAVANPDRTVKELSYTNNSSPVVTVNTISPYRVEINCDKPVYAVGEGVTLSGVLAGHNVANTPVEVYVINDNYRHTIQVTTNNNGQFTTTYKPYAQQLGHFVVGACYPGEKSDEESCAFDIYGLKFASNSAVACMVVLGTPYQGSFEISNPGTLPLSGLTVNVDKQPDNCTVRASIEQASSLSGGESTLVHYTIETSAVSPVYNQYQSAQLSITSKEGASLSVPLYYNCRNAQPQLCANVTQINTTVTQGTTREYPIVITNLGQGETGEISLSLPDCIGSITPLSIGSLANGDSATVILLLKATEQMQLNVPVTGSIGINCSRCDLKSKQLSIPFSIEAVSATNGTLTIDVCDEYTYYTDLAPHVSGASVLVKHPTTGSLIASGTTDATGKYSVSLPGGYYAVSVNADNHSSYSNNLFVDPDKEKKVSVNLSVQAITVGWNVENTEVEDEYSIVTTVKYETNVPVPVVELSVPSSIAAKELAEGESLIFYATLTNKGLITAQDVQFLLPSGFTALQFKALDYTEPFDLAPQQSVQIPVKVTHVSTAKYLPAATQESIRPIDNDPCVGNPGTLYYWECGNDRQWHKYYVALQLGPCDSTNPKPLVISDPDDDNVIYWGGLELYIPSLGGSGGGGVVLPTIKTTPIVTIEDTGCIPCQNKIFLTMAKCAGKYVPVIKEVWDVVEWVRKPKDKLKDAIVDYLSDEIAEYIPVYGWVKKIIGYKEVYDTCIQPLLEPCEYEGDEVKNLPSRLASNSQQSSLSYLTEFQNEFGMLNDVAQAKIAEMTELFGNDEWLQCDEEQLYQFLVKFQDYASQNATYEDICLVKPDAISTETLKLFVERWENTVNEQDVTNKIDINKINAAYTTIDSAWTEIMAKGYDSFGAYYDDIEAKFLQRLEEQTNSVCASISLQFSQTMTMTRQAFRGTLTVYNGHESKSMQQVKLTLDVVDEDGKKATSHEFLINPESLQGFSGELSLTDGWTLEAQETGVATILFIPSKYAAATAARKYSFGGTLTYVDPFTGLEVSRDLTPITLTVNPSPNLNLTYFMQRDILGDDPSTIDVVEPSQEAEFSLLISNIGYGDATNVYMVTNQPEIVDNEKGLYVDFELISSQLNGGDKTLALGGSVGTNFGTIPAQGHSYAQWWIKSSLLGHFVDYDVEATHVTSYNNPDLSLLNEVDIKELIRSLEVRNGENTMVGFLTNDQIDAEDQPDMLYLSNGQILDVAQATSVSISSLSNNSCTLTVHPSESGWNYGSVADPSYGLAQLKSVVRQRDQQEMPLRNFWQTDRTLRDGANPLYENRIHFADLYADANAEESYLLTYEDIPSLRLAVTTIEGMPIDGTPSSTPVDLLSITFNKPINTETFSTKDLTLIVQGEPQDISNAKLSTDDSKTFLLDLSPLGDLGNGYYVLTVTTKDIVDYEGYLGNDGKSVGWNYYNNGQVQLSSSVLPNDAGSILVTGNCAYGTTAVLHTTPNVGYEFVNWTINDEVVSTYTTYSCNLIGDMSVTANYRLKSFVVTVDTDIEGGSISGSVTGSYNYGEELSFQAQPEDDYQLVEWLVNGTAVGTDSNLKIRVEQSTNISARFEQVRFEQVFTLRKGWNWVSTYFSEPLQLNWLDSRISQIRSSEGTSSTETLTLAPNTAYKVKAAYSFATTQKGTLSDANTIALKAGWNWIGYPLHETQNIGSILSGAEDGDVLSGQLGFTTYSNQTWNGTLQTLTPGRGYLYHSVSEKSLTLLEASATTSDEEVTIGQSLVDVYAYPSAMHLIIQVDSKEATFSNERTRIYAMAGNECRGISQPIGDVQYLTVYGEDSVDIAFVVEVQDLEESVLTDVVIPFKEGIIGSNIDPYIMKLSALTDLVLSVRDLEQTPIYTIQGLLVSPQADTETLMKLSPGIYIIRGRKYIVR